MNHHGELIDFIEKGDLEEFFRRVELIARIEELLINVKSSIKHSTTDNPNQLESQRKNLDSYFEKFKNALPSMHKGRVS